MSFFQHKYKRNLLCHILILVQTVLEIKSIKCNYLISYHTVKIANINIYVG